MRPRLNSVSPSRCGVSDGCEGIGSAACPQNSIVRGKGGPFFRPPPAAGDAVKRVLYATADRGNLRFGALTPQLVAAKRITGLPAGVSVKGIDFRPATGDLWSDGPGDMPGHPNRISAGTFHSDEHGRSHVRFAAAVDPARYPVLAVTAEPGDGDPRANGVEVLRD